MCGSPSEIPGPREHNNLHCRDDLKAIRAGKWVAWKRPTEDAAAGGRLFVPNAFYNLLLPQRPRGV